MADITKKVNDWNGDATYQGLRKNLLILVEGGQHPTPAIVQTTLKNSVV